MYKLFIYALYIIAFFANKYFFKRIHMYSALARLFMESQAQPQRLHLSKKYVTAQKVQPHILSPFNYALASKIAPTSPLKAVGESGIISIRFCAS